MTMISFSLPRMVFSLSQTTLMISFSSSQGLVARGVQAQMAKSSIQQPEQDPTNLYIANLPLDWTESNLETMLKSYGMVISTRILRNQVWNQDKR